MPVLRSYGAVGLEANERNLLYDYFGDAWACILALVFPALHDGILQTAHTAFFGSFVIDCLDGCH